MCYTEDTLTIGTNGGGAFCLAVAGVEGRDFVIMASDRKNPESSRYKKFLG